MKRLTDIERLFIDQILTRLSLKARSDYLSYRQTGGYRLRGIDEVDTAMSLWRKGWLVDEPEIFGDHPIYLKPEAWRRFALDEWVELEEKIMESKRGDVSGSW